MSGSYPSWLQRIKPGTCWWRPEPANYNDYSVYGIDYTKSYYDYGAYPDDYYDRRFPISEQQPPDPPPQHGPPSWSSEVRGCILGDDQQPLGPYSLSTLYELHSRGYLPHNTLFWADECRDWQPISSVLGFSSRYNPYSFSNSHSGQSTQQPQYSVSPPQQPSAAVYYSPQQPPSAASYDYPQQQVQTQSVLPQHPPQQTEVRTSQPQAVVAPADTPFLPAQSLLRAPHADEYCASLQAERDKALQTQDEVAAALAEARRTENDFRKQLEADANVGDGALHSTTDELSNGEHVCAFGIANGSAEVAGVKDFESTARKAVSASENGIAMVPAVDARLEMAVTASEPLMGVSRLADRSEDADDVNGSAPSERIAEVANEIDNFFTNGSEFEIAANLMAKPLSYKLGRRYYGPFTIVESIGPVAYRLELPPGARIHDVFHVSLLKKFVAGKSPALLPTLPSGFMGSRPLMSPLRILDRRTTLHHGAMVEQVLVDWSADGSIPPTWEPAHIISDRFPSLLEDKESPMGGGVVTGEPLLPEEVTTIEEVENMQESGRDMQDSGQESGKEKVGDVHAASRPQRKRAPPTKYKDYVAK